MPTDNKRSQQTTVKQQLHPRNPHNRRYDFKALTTACPELSEYTHRAKSGDTSIDFSNPKAVKALNKALLKQFYNVDFWDIPEGYLCPAIPGRADYIHYLADLLAETQSGNTPTGKKIKVLDIGTGANCVYPIIGSQSYGWQMTGSDINQVSINSAKQLIKFNKNLSSNVKVVLQKEKKSIFHRIIKPEQHFDLTLCNPPFHRSAADAAAGTQRKNSNLNRKQAPNSRSKAQLNFGGQHAELWCDGGELKFIKQMITESVDYKAQCLWFTCLVSQKSNLPAIYGHFEKLGITRVKTIDMAQGQKVSRFIAWSFKTDKEMQNWIKAYWS